MRLDILNALNEERAARRAVIVVTNQDSGAQRLVKGTDIRNDPLKDVLEKHLRSGKSGIEETPEGQVFLTVHVPPPQLVITGAVHISQALAPMAPVARLRRHHRRSAHRVCQHRALSRRQGDRRMAGHGAAAARHRPLHGVRRAHPRSQDRRSGARSRAEARLLLYRRARLAEDPCPPGRAAEDERGFTDNDIGAHPCADRARHRRGVAVRDRGRHHGRDHAAAARRRRRQAS